MPHYLEAITKHLLNRAPDLSSGSNDIYFQDSSVIKILKPNAALYQFIQSNSLYDAVAMLENIKQHMQRAFGDMLPPTQYNIYHGRIVTTQRRIVGETLRALGQSEDIQIQYRAQLKIGILELRKYWQGNRELLGFIIDEINDPNNAIFDGRNFFIIDWF